MKMKKFTKRVMVWILTIMMLCQNTVPVYATISENQEKSESGSDNVISGDSGGISDGYNLASPDGAEYSTKEIPGEARENFDVESVPEEKDGLIGNQDIDGESVDVDFSEEKQEQIPKMLLGVGNPILASGTSGTCIWTVAEDEDGIVTLTIEPESGNEGTLAYWYGEGTPWYNYREIIQSVSVHGEIQAPEHCHAMFADFSCLQSVDLDGLKTNGVIDMSNMFFGCGKLKEIDLSNLDTSASYGFDRMFFECADLETVNLNGINTSRATDMHDMFYGCESLTELDLRDFDTNSVVDMAGMFNECKSLTELELSSFDTTNVADMHNMFYGCSNLETLDLSRFNTSKVEDMSDMFCYCENLAELKLSSDFVTSKVEDMGYMFYCCESLIELDLSSFDTGNVTTMRDMFFECKKLKTIKVDSFDIGKVDSLDIDSFMDSHSMFYNCISLIGGKGTVYVPYNDGKEYARIDGGPSNPGYFTDINDIPESNLKITKFNSPSGNYRVKTQNGLRCYAFEIENGTSEILIDIEVAEGAEWNLYSDSNCQNAIDKNRKVSLPDDTNYFYVKVYTDNESAVYAIELTKSQPELPYSESKELVYRDGTRTTVTWGSSLFDCSATTYNRNLDLVGLYLAEAAESSSDAEIREKMIGTGGLGFTNFRSGAGFWSEDVNKPAIAVGATTYHGEFNGNSTKYLICAAIRGTFVDKPTIDKPNFGIGDILTDLSSVDNGFLPSGEYAYKFIMEYVQSNYPDANVDNTVFFITGHSLGAATAGVVATLLQKEYYATQTFVYTYAPPHYDTSVGNSAIYYNVHNTVNENDIVPYIPTNYGGAGYCRKYTSGYSPEKKEAIRDILNSVALMDSGLKNLGFIFGAKGLSLYFSNNMLDEHMTYTYLDLVLNHSPISVSYNNNSQVQISSVKCPVDIKLYDEKNQLVAETEYDKAYNYGNGDLLVMTDGDDKYIIHGGNREYRIVFKSTASGVMEYETYLLDNIDGEVDKKTFDKVILQEGKEFTSEINSSMPISSTKLFVVDEKGNATREVNENGTETPISTTYTVSFNANGHGTAPASQQISAGEKVSKPADSTASGYTFGGWYKEPSCINQWNFDTEVVNSSTTLYAKWTSNSSSSSSSGTHTSGGGSSSGGGGGSVSKAKTGTGATYSPNWFVDASGIWKIRNSKGEVVKNAWLCDDVITANGKNVWYLLQADGSMLTAGLVQDNTGNFYSLETTHNGYFGMMRYKDGYYDCNGQQVYLKFNQKHDNSFGAVINEDGLEKLKQIYGITKYPIGNETCTYTASF